jgi:hypothetical protein
MNILGLFQVKVMLQPMINRPVSLGISPHLGPKIRFMLDGCGFVDVGRLVKLLLAFTSPVFLGFSILEIYEQDFCFLLDMYVF